MSWKNLVNTDTPGYWNDQESIERAVKLIRARANAAILSIQRGNGEEARRQVGSIFAMIDEYERRRRAFQGIYG